MKKLALTLLLAATSTLTPHAHAFGANGHRITGAIATEYLTPQAKQQLEAILGVETLAQASTWPDEMRSNPDEYWQKTTPPWHYVSVPDGKTYKEVGAPDVGDAYTALANFTIDLQDQSSSIEVKQRAVRFIVHIIGDLHQPLHVGNGTDRGGNDHKVEFYWEESNLHRVWDSGLINKEELSYSEFTEWLLAAISEKDVKDWHQTDPLVWMTESQKIRMDIYPEKNAQLSWNYKYEHMPTVKKRLKQAGVRIAHYLNEIFEK
ncbi:S1/P1 nuclease [Planctobacterium marinum]|uniref:Endonuclease n=1 Tax=Planctobacterium marinum TaxID=1631968 RepID=A0AA48HR86_9ALTE|nr:endonuclease [Planctobacterium marinum]